MEDKPSGVVRLKAIDKTAEGYRLFFKSGPRRQIETILLHVDEEKAGQFEVGAEYKFTISFERIIHSGPA